MRHSRVSRLTIGFSLGAVGCGGGGTSTATVTATVTARILKGPSPVVAKLQAFGNVPLSSGHRLYVTADQVKATVSQVGVRYVSGGPSGETLPALLQFPVSNCEVTYDASTPTLSTLLDCPVELPVGDVDEVFLDIDASAYQVLIDDASDGLFSDAATGALTATRPSAGAGFIAFPGTSGTSTYSFMRTPFTIAQAGEHGDAAVGVLSTINVLTHATHVITVSGDGLQFVDVRPPVLFVPSVSPVTSTSFYSSVDRSGNIDVDWSSGPPKVPTELFLFSDASGPSLVFVNGVGPSVQGCYPPGTPNTAFAIASNESPVGNDGNRSGGWLGKDSSGTICFALGSADNKWTTSSGLFEVPEIGTPGGMATFNCQATTTAPAPTSGDTYASGCPQITSTGSTTLYLVAR